MPATWLFGWQPAVAVDAAAAADGGAAGHGADAGALRGAARARGRGRGRGRPRARSAVQPNGVVQPFGLAWAPAHGVVNPAGTLPSEDVLTRLIDRVKNVVTKQNIYFK